MFAFFGLPGHIELLIIIGMLASVGTPLLIVVVVLAVNRRQRPSTSCPQCGEMMSPQSNFCSHCGAKTTPEG